MGITALVGAYNAFFEYNPPALEFYTASSVDEWHLRVPAEPPEPAEACSPSETLWAYELKPSMRRDVNLCFDPGGKSEAEIADEMAEDDFKVTEALRQDDPYAGLGTYEQEAESGTWWSHRVADFSITPAALTTIEKELPRMERERLINHVTEVLSIAAYFIGGFWLFSIVIGWIVRGFAGIPRGQDFRPAQQSDAGG
jgi:hypothetical protein